MVMPERNTGLPRPAATDPELIESALSGNQMAFQLLLERYRSVVTGYLWGKLPPDVDPEDVLQDVFVSVFRNLHRLRDRRRVGPWLVTIARNCVNDTLRRRAIRFRAPSDPHQVDTEAQSSSPTPAQLTASKEVTNEIAVALGTIPDKYRIVLSMRLLDELSLGEIAATLGITENSARVRLHRGLEKLHRQLDRRGIGGSSITL